MRDAEFGIREVRSWRFLVAPDYRLLFLKIRAAGYARVHKVARTIFFVRDPGDIWRCFREWPKEFTLYRLSVLFAELHIRTMRHGKGCRDPQFDSQRSKRQYKGKDHAT